MHHYYLGRTRQGFVWWTTLGGFGIGWLTDVFKIRRYVLDANEDFAYMAELLLKMSRIPKVNHIEVILNGLISSTFFLFG